MTRDLICDRWLQISVDNARQPHAVRARLAAELAKVIESTPDEDTREYLHGIFDCLLSPKTRN